MRTERQSAPRAVSWLLALALLPVAGHADGWAASWTDRWRNLWRTPDQQAQRLFDGGDYAGAAAKFGDPMRVGTAWYRAGEFERAAAAFGQLSAAEGHYNRANALLMHGKYDEAVTAYEQALAQRPDWQPAVDNRALALARKARLAPPEDDAGGTGGMLAADDFVLDDSGRTDQAGSEQTTEGGSALTDARMRELWLRRVETRPADFLRARFSRQLQVQPETAP